MSWYFVFFFVSGFCSILYEIVWLRLSMAQFGVTSALVSIVLSMFMAGLGLGSWGSGYAMRKYEERNTVPALRLYALIELLIVVAIILVIAAIAIPNLLRARLAANEASAAKSVRWCACSCCRPAPRPAAPNARCSSRAIR